MTLHTWALFTASAFALAATPGPNMLYVLSCSAEVGLRRSVPAMAGCVSALFVVLCASAGRLSASVLALPGAFTILRCAGAGYLFHLGVKAWSSDAAIRVDASPRGDPSSTALLRGGFLTGISNPKLLLFAAAFLPQFVDTRMPRGPQLAVLISTDLAVEIVWCGVYGAGGRSISRHLARPALRRVFHLTTGGVFICLAIAFLVATIFAAWRA